MSSAQQTPTKPDTIRIAAPAITALREQLLQSDGNERYAVAHCTHSNNRQVLLVEQVNVLPDAALDISSPGACRPTPSAERTILTECLEAGRIPFVIHSHPFTAEPSFSTRDREMMHRYQDWLHPLYPDTPLMFGVLGTELLTATAASPGQDSRSPVSISVVGDWTLSTPATPRMRSTAESEIDTERYDRSIRAYGESAQRQLAASHVAVIGCGGIGSYLATGLARLGIGELTLIDPDHVEQSNLPRLAGATPGDIDQPKVSVVQQQCIAANPALETTIVTAPCQEVEAQLASADLLIAGVDRVNARLWLNEFAVRHLLPYIDAGSVIELTETGSDPASTELYIQTIAPGVTACFDCLNRGDAERARVEQLSETELASERSKGYIADTDLTPEPAVLPLNLHAVAHALDAAVAVLTDAGTPVGLLRYDTTAGRLQPITTHPSDACLICGQDGFLGRGDAQPRTQNRSITMVEDDAVLSPDAVTDAITSSADTAADTDRFATDAVAAWFANQHPL